MGHIHPCDVETNGGDCSCADIWSEAFLEAKAGRTTAEMRVEELEAALHQMLSVVDECALSESHGAVALGIIRGAEALLATVDSVSTDRGVEVGVVQNEPHAPQAQDHTSRDAQWESAGRPTKGRENGGPGNPCDAGSSPAASLDSTDPCSSDATPEESKWPCFWCGSMQAHETGWPGGMSTVPACREHAAKYPREKGTQVTTMCGAFAVDDAEMPCIRAKDHRPPHVDENGEEWGDARPRTPEATPATATKQAAEYQSAGEVVPPYDPALEARIVEQRKAWQAAQCSNEAVPAWAEEARQQMDRGVTKALGEQCTGHPTPDEWECPLCHRINVYRYAACGSIGCTALRPNLQWQKQQEAKDVYEAVRDGKAVHVGEPCTTKPVPEMPNFGTIARWLRELGHDAVTFNQAQGRALDDAADVLIGLTPQRSDYPRPREYRNPSCLFLTVKAALSLLQTTDPRTANAAFDSVYEMERIGLRSDESRLCIFRGCDNTVGPGEAGCASCVTRFRISLNEVRSETPVSSIERPCFSSHSGVCIASPGCEVVCKYRPEVKP